ncbi:hypothetical protein D3C71_1797450 [compost metagenome]
MQTTAPNPALELTPRMPGSASGLRSKPCKAAPETPSDMPTSTASSTRGRRISWTMAWWRKARSLPPPWANTACHQSATPIRTEPMPKDTQASTSSAASKPRLSSHGRGAAGTRVMTSAPRQWA